MCYESPLPLFIGLDIHTRLRPKKIVTELHELGLSVSYDRVLQLENQLATAVCLHTQKEGVVCPPQLRPGLFTVGTVDNLDHNPSSTTATGSFHGTGISLFQSPTKTNMGSPEKQSNSRLQIQSNAMHSQKVSQQCQHLHSRKMLQKCQSSPVLLSLDQIL